MQVGDIVRLITNVHGEGQSNPIWGGSYGHINGTIDEIHGGSIHVQWLNGGHNTYVASDLQLEDGKFKQKENVTVDKLVKIHKKQFCELCNQIFKVDNEAKIKQITARIEALRDKCNYLANRGTFGGRIYDEYRIYQNEYVQTLAIKEGLEREGSSIDWRKNNEINDLNFKSFRKHKNFDGLYTDPYNEAIYVKTNKIVREMKNIKQEIGSLVFVFMHNYVGVYNLDWVVLTGENDFKFSPHNRNGQVCLGEIQQEIAKHLKNRNLYFVFELIIRNITSELEGNPYLNMESWQNMKVPVKKVLLMRFNREKLVQVDAPKQSPQPELRGVSDLMEELNRAAETFRRQAQPTAAPNYDATDAAAWQTVTYGQTTVRLNTEDYIPF